MDADTLRLILVVLGGVLILGIYLWERHQRTDARIKAIRHAQHQKRVEPTLDSTGAVTQTESTPVESDDDSGLDTALKELGDLVSEERKPRPEDPKRWQKRQRNKESRKPEEHPRQDMFADEAVADTDHRRQADPGIPTMILQINVVSRDDGFHGMDIMRVVQGLDLSAGDMQIFHRCGRAGRNGPVLFSMASLVEPGIFPLDSMEDYKTPGLTLFAQLPGPEESITLFSDMLSTAESLAAELNGELQDETHSRLTKQTVEHMRSQILEYNRKVQLAKSKLR